MHGYCHVRTTQAQLIALQCNVEGSQRVYHGEYPSKHLPILLGQLSGLTHQELILPPTLLPQNPVTIILSNELADSAGLCQRF